VSITIPVSSLIESPELLRVDQWLIRVQPRQRTLKVVDYAPRTAVAAETNGPIQVVLSDEDRQSVGLSVDGALALAAGHLGIESAAKASESMQYETPPPMEVVVASGTIDRGRGVYFKLRSTAGQVLDGEKRLHVSFAVPPQWRAGLFQIAVTAQSVRRTLGGLDSGVKTLGSERFMVAAYREGDEQARHLSRRLAIAEQRLRETAHLQANHSVTLTSLFQNLPFAGRAASGESIRHDVERLIHGEADPYMDRVIRKSTKRFRKAVLDYFEIRDELLSLNTKG